MISYVLLRYRETGRVDASTLFHDDDDDAISVASHFRHAGPIELWSDGRLVWRSRVVLAA